MASYFETASDDFMEEDQYQVHEPEAEPEPEPEPEPDPQPEVELSQDQPMPSIERNTSVLEQSQEQGNNTPQSDSPSLIKNEHKDSTVSSPKSTPHHERQVSSDGVRTPEEASPVRNVQLPATASPERPMHYPSTSSLAPVFAASLICGPPLRPPAPLFCKNGGPVGGPVNPSFNNGGPVKHAPTHKPTQPEGMMIDDDEDDDCMIIEPGQASLVNQEKWKSASPRVLDDDVVFVKEEKRGATPLSSIPTSSDVPLVEKEKGGFDPRSSVPPPRASIPPRNKPIDVAKLMHAQHAMLNRNRSVPYDNGEGGSRGHMRAEPARNFDHFKDDALGDQEDSVMGGTGGEDTAWMDEEDNDVDPVYEGWIKLRNYLLCKQRTNKITPDESLRLFKLKQSIETRDRVRAAVLHEEDQVQDEDEDSLFVPETTKQANIRRLLEKRRRDSADREIESQKQGRKAMDGEYVDDEAMARMFAEADDPNLKDKATEDLGFTKSGKPRKRRAKAAKNSSEYVSRQEEQRREKERTKAQKQKSGGRKVKSPVAARGKGKAKDTGKSKKGKGKSKGKGKEIITNGQSLLASGDLRKFEKNNDAAAMMILEDLMHNDPISDRLQNPIFNRPAEEAIVGPQTKATQFQLLFANIPDPEDEIERIAICNDKTRLRDASKSFGYAKCKAVNGKWLIKGMKSTLYHHQLLGAEWMIQRELSSQAPHGGILADSMGLGKTVQTLACMVANAPGEGDRRRNVKATLIIGPAAICSQWIDEILVHVEGKVFPKIIHYKTSSNLSADVLQDADIVVTSYNTVCNQFPFPDKEGKLQIARDGYHAWHKKAIENMGVLHSVNWYRVVLDEAHNIKNNASRTSLACQNLKSVYRWCLTGTPLLNRLEELFPYLRFLRANYSMDWGMFQKYFCDPNHTDSDNRIATLLSYTMMRRTMETSILNRPIISLPKPTAEVMNVSFSAEETIIYRITENRFRNNLNAFYKNGEASRNYGVFMVQLLRLRQCTSHPFMLERTIKESWTMEDVQELKRLLGKSRLNGKPFYDQCELWVETNEARRVAARARGEVLADDEMLPFGQSSYGYNFNMDQALKTLNETELYERVTCSLCSDIPINPHKTDCGHIFCKDCIDTFTNQLVAQDHDYMICPQCNRVFQLIEAVHGPDPDPVPSSSSRSKSGSKANGKGKGKERQRNESQADDEDDEERLENMKHSKGRDLMRFEPKTMDSSWVTRSDIDPKFPLTPSTKTAALKALLLKGFEEAPNDKVVIYVQFRTLARIIGRICNAEGWGFLYLTGDSSLDHRERAIKRFRDDPHAMILVAGLKCGGLGLNFPFANRCISLDLWWNHAVEQQAFGRIFRIGQKKETYMTRIVVRNSVDMRMLAMQLHKLQNIEKAIPQGGDVKKRQALSLKQLANLFGFLRTDGDGQILSVEADYRDGESEGEVAGFGFEGGSQDVDGDGDESMDKRGGNGNGNGEGSSGGARGRGRAGNRVRANTGPMNWSQVSIDGYRDGYGDVMERVVDSDEDI